MVILKICFIVSIPDLCPLSFFLSLLADNLMKKKTGILKFDRSLVSVLTT